MIQSKISKIAFISINTLIVVLSILLIYHTSYYDHLSKEDHLAEYLSAFFLLLSSLFFARSIYLNSRIQAEKNFGLVGIFSFISIILFLAAGEEISWGQRIFDIKTPQYLLEINDQDELNFHNIDKKFFDRLLDRLTIVFVLIGAVFLILKKPSYLKLKTPDLYIICSFALTAFYKQDMTWDFFHLSYVPLILISIYSFRKRIPSYMITTLVTLLMTVFIHWTHNNYGHLFPKHNNSADEFKEFMFCFCVMTYSYLITSDINRKIVIE